MTSPIALAALVGALGHPLHHGVADAGRAHLGREVVRRHVLGRGHQDATLPLERLLPPAVEEEGDVRVLLGLGHVELTAPGARGALGEPLAHVLGLEEDLRGELGLVAGHGRERRRRGRRPPVELVEGGLAQRHGELAGAVRAEVPVDDPVAGADAVLPGRPDDRRLDELIRDTSCIRGVDRGATARAPLADAVHEGVVGAPGAVPAAVAIHGPVAADDRGDHDARRLDLGHRVEAGVRSRVATVGERVDDDALDPGLAREPDEREDVALARVDPAVAGQADEVQRPPAAGVEGRPQRRQPPEGAVGDGLVDPHQHLRNPAAGAEVQVADLAVALLALGQAHRQPRRRDAGARRLGGERIEVRLPRQVYGVAGPRRRDPVAVDDHQDEGPARRHGGRLTAPPRRSPRSRPGRGSRRRPAPRGRPAGP